MHTPRKGQVRTAWEGSHMRRQPGRETSQGTEWAHILLWDSYIQNYEKEHFCCLSHLNNYILLWKPKKIKTKDGKDSLSPEFIFLMRKNSHLTSWHWQLSFTLLETRKVGKLREHDIPNSFQFFSNLWASKNTKETKILVNYSMS